MLYNQHRLQEVNHNTIHPWSYWSWELNVHRNPTNDSYLLHKYSELDTKRLNIRTDTTGRLSNILNVCWIMSCYFAGAEAFALSFFPTTMAVPSKQVVLLFTLPQTSLRKESQQSLTLINEPSFPQSEFTNLMSCYDCRDVRVETACRWLWRKRTNTGRGRRAQITDHTNEPQAHSTQGLSVHVFTTVCTQTHTPIRYRSGRKH